MAGFFGGGLLALDREDLVAHEFMAVAGHHGQTVGRQVEVDAVHHGAQLVLCRGEDRAVDVLCQDGIGDGDGIGEVAHGLGHGELIGILDGQGEQAVLVGDLHDVLLLVHLEGDGLLGEALHGFQQVVVADGEAAVAVALRQVHLGLHRVLAVRCRQVQHAVVDLKHEVAKDRQGVLTVNHSREGREPCAQCGA